MFDPTLDDSAARANVDIFCDHIYGGGIAIYPLATRNGRELFTTGIFNTDISLSAVIGTAKQIHDCMNVAGFNSYCWWHVKRDYGPVNEAGARIKPCSLIAVRASAIAPKMENA